MNKEELVRFSSSAYSHQAAGYPAENSCKRTEMIGNMKRHSLLAALIALLCIFSLSIAILADEPLTVRVGAFENPPKIFTDESGTFSGFWPDLVNYIASQEGWQIEWVHGTWTQCLEKLERNEIDVLPDTGFTEPRAEKFAFSSETVLLSWSRLCARRGADIDSVLDLERTRIGALAGSFNLDGPKGIRDICSGFEIGCTFVEMDSYTEVFEALEDGSIDAGVTNKDFGNKYEDQYKIEKTPIIFQPARMQFAFTQDSDLTPYLIERIDYHIKELKKDENSIYYQSLEKWLGVTPGEKPVMPAWVGLVVIGIGALVLLLVGGTFVLRFQVKEKTRALKQEIDDHKKAEERIEHLNLVLRAIRNVNQLITKEKDRDRLLQGACDNLIGTRGYHHACIAIIDEAGGFITAVEAGLGSRLLPLVEQLEQGEWPECMQRALTQSEPVVTEDPSSTRIGCPSNEEDAGRGTLTVRLNHEGKVYGMVSASVPRESIADEEKQGLFKEVADDIACALHNIEMEEKRVRAEEALRKSDRALRALSGCNQIIVRVTEEAKLLSEICRIIVEVGQYPLAWVGFAEQDEEKTVRPVAQAGFEEVYLDTVNITWADTERGHGPTGTAIRTGEVSIAQNILTDPNCVPWRAEATKHGYVSLLALPLHLGDHVSGGLSIFASEPDAFDEEEVKLLTELSEDLAYGIRALRSRAERRKAEEEKERMEAQLRQSQKLESIGTLASGVAHEINNPVTGIINYADLIESRVEDDRLREFAAGIIKEGNRVAEIVKSLLYFSRQEKQSHSPARMEDIINASLTLIGAVLRKDQITVEKEIAPDLPQVRCRSQQIQQVIINLLTNARDALNQRYEAYHEDKLIKIRVQPFEEDGIQWIRTTVEDHGTGIPEEAIDRIFDPFFTSKPRDAGTGLGLSVSYGIIKEHHGELSVESELGEYTRFHMDLRVDNGWTVE